MTVLTNGRAYALSVGAKLYLPTGRAVPLTDAGGWEETDADPSAATPACLAAAQAEEDALVALGPPPRFVLPSAPRVDPPRPLVEDPGVVDFCARCAAVAATIGDRDSLAASGHRAKLERLEGYARRAGEVSDGSIEALERLESAWDPADVASFLAAADAFRAWALSTAGAGGWGDFLARRFADAVYGVRVQGCITANAHRETARLYGLALGHHREAEKAAGRSLPAPPRWVSRRTRTFTAEEPGEEGCP